MKKTNWWKLAVIAAILAIAFYSGCKYGVNSFTKKISKVDTTISKVVYDTIYLPTPDSAIKLKIVYKDTGSVITEYLDGKAYPVFIDTTRFPKEIVEDYYTIRPYYDSVNGVRIWDTVYQNKLVRQRVKNYRTDTTITKTDIVVQPRPFQLFYGIDLGTNYSGTFKLDFKFPKDNTIISLGLGAEKQKPIFYQIGFRRLLKLK